MTMSENREGLRKLLWTMAAVVVGGPLTVGALLGYLLIGGFKGVIIGGPLGVVFAVMLWKAGLLSQLFPADEVAVAEKST